MVKKLQKMAEKKSAGTGGLLDHHLAATVKDSAQQIWLAGLGAFSKAQEEGGKVFEALVKEGLSIQRKTQSAAEERVAEVTQKMSQTAGDITSKAGQQWDKLEQIFEDRVSRALGKLGVPSAKDVESLAARVDALNQRLSALGGAKTSARRAAKSAANGATPAKRAPAKSASGKQAAGKRAPAKRASTKRTSA